MYDFPFFFFSFRHAARMFQPFEFYWLTFVQYCIGETKIVDICRIFSKFSPIFGELRRPDTGTFWNCSICIWRNSILMICPRCAVVSFRGSDLPPPHPEETGLLTQKVPFLPFEPWKFNFFVIFTPSFLIFSIFINLTPINFSLIFVSGCKFGMLFENIDKSFPQNSSFLLRFL